MTVRRLNRYEVTEIQWLSGVKNLVSERDIGFLGFKKALRHCEPFSGPK